MRQVTVSCPAGPGEGGLGLHFLQLLEWLHGRGDALRYYAPSVVGDRSGEGIEVVPRAAFVASLPPMRLDARLRAFVGSAIFDRAVAAALRPGSCHFGFAGQSLETFRCASAAHSELVLVSPTAHVSTVQARYASAYRRYPIERPWLGRGLALRTVAEYSLADQIHITSEYVRRSFLDAGFPADRLERFELSVPERFRPDPAARDGDTFRVIYVGGLTVAKGVPVLLDAFARLRLADARLTLVGGWSSRGMRRFVSAALARDTRIEVVLGDPLPHLQRAHICVHPSFQDGFGYAAMEALACGALVVVTEDTGMKEHVRDGVNGWIVPTGDVDALVDRLMQAADQRQ